jgi:predicted kinase
VCLIGGSPVVFDAIEFSEELSCIDVLYDFAFLLMDFLHRGMRVHANLTLNGYLEIRRDLPGLALLPLFLSCRAAIRAKVSLAAAIVQPDASKTVELRAEAGGYLELAERLLEPVPAGVLAIGGYSGSGKSSLARRLAPALGPPPGAVVLRSDVMRKRMFGLDPLEPLPDEAYAPEASDRVYAQLVKDAEAAARAGHSVIVDAVFSRPAERADVEQAARRAGVPFQAIWLEVPTSVAVHRLAERKDDASDATPTVLLGQVARGAGTVSWVHIDASGSLDEVERRALDQMAPRPDGAGR